MENLTWQIVIQNCIICKIIFFCLFLYSINKKLLTEKINNGQEYINNNEAYNKTINYETTFFIFYTCFFDDKY